MMNNVVCGNQGDNPIWSLARPRLPHPYLLPLWEGEGIRSAISRWFAIRFAIGRSFSTEIEQSSKPKVRAQGFSGPPQSNLVKVKSD